MKKSIFKTTRLLFMSLLLCNACFIVSGQVKNTSAGTNFWFGFPYNTDEGSVTYAISMTSFVNTTGTVSVPGTGFTQNFTITAGVVTYIILSPSDVMVNTPDVIADNAVHVTTNNPIALFFSEEETGPRDDNSFVLPDTALGNDYYVISYAYYNSLAFNHSISEFMVIAPGSTVRVEVTPSGTTTTGHLAGVAFDTTLVSGQVLQLRSTTDLTGSRVRSLDSTQKFAVIGANAMSVVNCSSTVDPLFEQSLPLSCWGKNYVVVSTPNSDDICRVLASQNGTAVNINGTVVTTLNAGQYYDTIVVQGSPFFITANNPISVARILQSSGCNSNSLDVGDPSLVLVDANEQMFLDSITFYADNLFQISSNYIQIVVRSTDVNTVFLDGSNIQSSFIALPANPAYSYANVAIQAGSHTLTTTGQGFVAYMCGLGLFTATACDAGVYIISPNPLTISTSFTPATCAGNNNGTAMVNATGGTPPYTYLWSPGGQTTQTVTGLAAGTYIVTVTDKISTTDIDSVTITQPPPLNAGTITALHDTICDGTLGRLTVTGNSGSVQWQSSATTGNFTNITGATNATYTALVQQTTYFRIYTTSGSCADTSAAFKLTVIPPPAVSFTSSVTGQQVTFNSNGSNGTGYYWDFGDGGNSTQPNPLHTFDTAGTHHVCLTITDNTNCTFTSCQNVTTFPTGVNNLNVEGEFQVYPNPFGNSIFIDGRELNQGIGNVTVYDVLGRTVFNEVYGSQKMIELPLFYLSAGMYYLDVKAGDSNYFKPIIKQ